MVQYPEYPDFFDRSESGIANRRTITEVLRGRAIGGSFAPALQPYYRDAYFCLFSFSFRIILSYALIRYAEFHRGLSDSSVSKLIDLPPLFALS